MSLARRPSPVLIPLPREAHPDRQGKSGAVSLLEQQ